jgi:hypothetical protein
MPLVRSLAAVSFACALGALAGCGGDDAPAAPDAFFSTCGLPGDEGNELGIGRFCETLGDCAGAADAPLCSNIGDATTWFCTRTCADETDDGVCGAGAECTCGDGGCGCTPSVCLQ